MSCLILASLLLLAEPKIDLQQYLVQTNHLIRIAKYDEALERCVWFHEHSLEHDPAMVGVRVSFALAAWTQLASKYPPAQKAMIETRDRAVEQLLKGEGGMTLFMDVAAFNRELLDNAKTVELFETLDQKHPELAKESFRVASELLFEAKKFDLLRKYLGPLDEAFETIRKDYDQSYQKLAADWENSGSARDFLKASFERQVLQLIKYALALGESEKARQIQNRAIEVLDRESIRNAIPSRPKNKS